MTTVSTPDAIDRLAGITTGAALDALRHRRPVTRLHAQLSHQALFEPAAPVDGERTRFTRAERFAVAQFVAELHAQPQATAFYAEGLEAAGGSATQRADLIPEARLAAALVHARLLVQHPRDAEASDLQALLDAGWSTTDIVTLSQLVSFLSFQIRAAAGLRVLAGRPAANSAA